MSPAAHPLSLVQVRHGATAALREVLRHHARAAAVVVSPAAGEEANTAWLQDCAIRLLCMFALDRYDSASLFNKPIP